MITKQEAKLAALAFLRHHYTGVVATTDKSGQPAVSPVYYASNDDLSIYFLTSRTTKKFANLSENNKVAFSVGFGPEYIAVDIRGRGEVVEGIELIKAFELLAEVQLKVPMAKWPINVIESLKSGLVLYKIIPDGATFLNIDSKEHSDSIADFIYQIVP